MPPSSFNPIDTIALQSPSPSVEFSPKIGPSFDPEAPAKRWYHYIPLCVAVLLILAPHPSWLFVLVEYHYKTLHRPVLVAVHLLVTYTLTFMIYSALIVCVARDPGPVTFEESEADKGRDEDGEAEALMPHEDYSQPGRWCRKCWGPKPERTHHCSVCGKCVLKMDHHCPWMGNKCIGHRTYPAFLHFILCITLLATYIAVVCVTALWHAFSDPLLMNELMPLHALFLTFYALVFALVMGSFYGYHIYLVLINQTTIENLSPFLILRHLPPLPRGGHDLSDPPLEQELSRTQRYLVKDAHGYIRLYDIGWRKNVQQVFGWTHPYGWVVRLWFGGAAPGNGRVFPRNPKSEPLLQRLAAELVKVEDRHR
ncbi:DHHC palmitoyltransferase-domain-containing protein [Roridomyces roridus]|uniref:Palmitoyltransferase n=1 Tax=Roridomyces roridus TaxID=1738132 RepID=A0AAD7FLN1_9AGAR|nr:DHHC palmitoyltransferase-domain-containing protein [Roridomyces roridus]